MIYNEEVIVYILLNFPRHHLHFKFLRSVEYSKCRKKKCLRMLYRLLQAGCWFLILENRTCLTKIRGSLNKFPDFFPVGTFIDSTHMKLKSPSE